MDKPVEGRLSVIGLGISLDHLTKQAENAIRTADVVFCIVNSQFAMSFLRDLCADVRDLRHLYAVGKERHDSYLEMVEVVLKEVRRGANVCFAVYGHPGIFAYPTHVAIKRARAEGYRAAMLPGISAEDCLYADLGIDPSWYGCQSFEATDFIQHRAVWSSESTLILYQVSITGITSLPKPGEIPSGFETLLARLKEAYGDDHVGTLYEASLFPFYPPRMEEMPLSDMRPEHFKPETTLVILPRTPHPSYQMDFIPIEATLPV